MSDTIIETFESLNLTQSGNKVATTIDGRKYFINKKHFAKINFPMNEPVALLISVQDMNGRKINWINWAGRPKTSTESVKPTPEAPKNEQKATILVSKYSEEDKTAFEANKAQMRRSCALNNSVDMACALAQSLKFNGLNDSEVKLYLDTERKRYYEEFLKLLEGVKPVKGQNEEELVSDEEYVPE